MAGKFSELTVKYVHLQILTDREDDVGSYDRHSTLLTSDSHHTTAQRAPDILEQACEEEKLIHVSVMSVWEDGSEGPGYVNVRYSKR